MSGFKFEGETDSISTKQKEYILQVLEKKGYKDCKINIKAVGKAGDNFVANVKRMTIEENGKDIFKMIAKIAPVNELTRAFGASMWFNNESVMFGEIFRKFYELQHKSDISNENYAFRAPECYGIIIEQPNELILLEDLDNYAMKDKMKPLTNESVKIILKKFAIMHSLSFVWRSKNSEAFEFTTKKLHNVFSGMIKMPGFYQQLIMMVNNSKAIVNDNDYEKVFEVLTSQLPDMLENLDKIEATTKSTVVIHGDAWINNMMFKEQDGKLDCIPIDFQQSKVGSPACDVLHLIFTSTDHETRLQHFKTWIDYYYTQLDQCLTNHGLDTNLVYPKKEFDADVKRYSKLYFVIGFFMFSMMFIKTEDAAALKEMQEKSTGDTNEMFANAAELFARIDCESLRGRLVGLVDSFREFDFIDI
ncbi:uncharacterized protein LOC128678404 [Plodia interpunctella]|uniref:uncharacterized protein LOC128678404 n=1 Tax=Plodia interpunctella TaxID=58824 RepID=UPI0023675EAD|nr:uncharacterized protein LOC128678404 [Plodia interpunctella]